MSNDRSDIWSRDIESIMQGKRKSGSMACTAWLVAGAVAPLGGIFVRPLALVGAVFVLFALVLAAVEVHH